jgi:cell division septum initiation protein DivIVA
MDIDFGAELRGYDKDQVNAVLARATTAVESASQVERSAMAAELSGIHFRLAMRGYIRERVDAHVSKVLQELRRT